MQLYDRGTIIERMIQGIRARTSAITYFGPGPFRAFLYAVAGEIQHLYYKLYKVEQKLDFLSATGTALDSYGQGRGLSRLGASSASVLIQLEANAIVPGTGTISSLDGVTVTGTNTAFDTEIAAGDTILVGSPSSINQAVVSSPSVDADGPLTMATSVTAITDQPFWIKKATVTIPDAPTPLRFSTGGGSVFEARESVTLRPTYSGSSVLRGIVRAQSLSTGSSQNVPAQTVRTVLNGTVVPQVTLTATNLAAAQGGTDAETDATFRTRILTLFAGLNQGTAAFYESQVRLLNSRVVRIFLARGGGVNEVLVYCATSDGSPLTTQEKQSLATGLAEVVPVQTSVTIRDMILQEINVAFTTTLSTGATPATVADNLATLYRELLDWSTWPFRRAVQADDLLRLASATPGVDSLKIETFSPTTDIELGAATLPRIGSITVTDASSGASTSITGVVQLYPRL